MRSSLAFAFALGLIAGCYRGEAPAPVVSGPAPLEQAPPPAPLVCGAGDRAHPPHDANPSSRLRSHVSGPLTGTWGGGQLGWRGPDVPAEIPFEVGTLQLMILDEVEGGHLAFYRDPYNQQSCTLSGPRNCTYLARFYDDHHRGIWSIRLDKFLSRRSHLEIQDIRLAGGVLYFNEACQSYSKGANGKCSSLVALDPRERRVLWRTPPLISNGRFALRGCYIVAGYGFTAEPDAVHLVDRGSGKVLQTIAVSSAPEGYRSSADDRLDVTLYSGNVRRYRLVGFGGAGGKLEALDPPERMFGGAGYGGVTYGSP